MYLKLRRDKADFIHKMKIAARGKRNYIVFYVKRAMDSFEVSLKTNLRKLSRFYLKLFLRQR